MAWCQCHAHFSQNDWRGVIFSDESTFCVLERKNQVKIWRTDEERLHQDCIQQVSRGKEESSAYGEVFKGQRPTEARIFNENMDGQTY